MIGRMKALARDGVARVLYSVGLTSPERLKPEQLLILTFHRVLPESLRQHYPLKGLAVTPEELRWVLSGLAPFFDVHSASSAVTRMSAPRSTPRPLMAVTFDDGQWDNYYYAAPVLEELGISGTFYVPTDAIQSDDLLWHDKAAFSWSRKMAAGKIAETIDEYLARLKRLPPTDREAELAGDCSHPVPDWARMMTWDEVRILHRRGHEIGSHGCSHGLLPQLPLDEQQREVSDSMTAIATATGETPKSFCYPNGDYTDLTQTLVREAGYFNAVTTAWGINAPNEGRYKLLRCDVDSRRLHDRSGRLSRPRLLMRISGRQPIVHPG